MKQLELMLTSGELNPRHQHTVTLYAKGLTCEADTLGSPVVTFIWLFIRRPKRKKHQNNLLISPARFFTTPLSRFLSSLHIRKIFSMKTLPDTMYREAFTARLRHHLADTAHPTAGPALRPHAE